MIEYLFIFAVALCLVRAAVGRTFADRVLAVTCVGNIVVILMVWFAIQTNEQMLMDIALLLTLLSFVGTIAIAKYVIPGRSDS